MAAAISKQIFTAQLLPDAPANARHARRIHIAPSVLKSSQICIGDFCIITPALSVQDIEHKLSIDKTSPSSPLSTAAVGIAWPSTSKSAQDLFLSNQLLQNAGLAIKDQACIKPIQEAPLATQVHITVSAIQQSSGKGKEKLEENTTFANYMKQRLVDAKYVCQGNQEVVSFNGIDYTIVYSKIEATGSPAQSSVYSVPNTTKLCINSSSSTVKQIVEPKRSEFQITQAVGYEAVGGLDAHIAQIRELIELPLTRPDLYVYYGLMPPRGVLLHGPPGTGKTLLASSVAASLKIPLFQIDGPSLSSPYHGETESQLRKLFEEAKACAPSIIVIDEIDALVPAREDSGEVERRVVATLLTLMDGLGDKPSSDSTARTGQVIVVACTNRPNAIDAALRRPGRFDREIEIGVPDASARESIIQVLLRNMPHKLTKDDIASLAGKTHGYVGADLSSLLHSAAQNSMRRNYNRLNPQTWIAEQNAKLDHLFLTTDDISHALLTTRPSALRSVFLETPKITWDEIGGQENVKRKLREVVEWPLQHPATFKRLGVKPPRGVLLYGPPGCSKTLIARALASGSGINFIAIKGPEIFQKYVGESERAIRETFRKARSAAPCIIFLDEIDVIAGSRDEGGPDTSDRVLTSLLTEMDGIEELNGVTVLAATNRPESIDSALMRPGRLDRILYVSPPDFQARCEILKVNFAKMAIDSAANIAELAEMTEGCSGAEMVSICQDAAYNAMNEDLEAPFVAYKHLKMAAQSIRRRITAEMVERYETWRDQSGVQSIA